MVLGLLCSSRFRPVPRVFLVFRFVLGLLVLWFLRLFGVLGSSSSPGFCSPLWVHGDHLKQNKIDLKIPSEEKKGFGIGVGIEVGMI